MRVTPITSKRSIPVIVCLQMLPDRVPRRNGVFAVHEEERYAVGVGELNLLCKEIKGSIASSSAHDSRLMALQSGGCKECCPRAAEKAFEVMVVVSTAFDVNDDTHQRLPPSCPEPQRSPRLYSSNQVFILALSNRLNRDSPFSCSHTTTLDG